MEFIESKIFNYRRKQLMSDEELKEIQIELLKFPEKGIVIKGTGGIRKVRTANRRMGKGKRGGNRLLYLHIPKINNIHLLYLFYKGEKENITEPEQKILKKLVIELKKETVKSGDKI